MTAFLRKYLPKLDSINRETYKYILLGIVTLIFLSSLILSCQKIVQYSQEIFKYSSLSFQSRQSLRYGEDYYKAVESAKKYLRKNKGRKLLFLGPQIVNGFSSLWLTEHLIFPEFEYASGIFEADVLIIDKKEKISNLQVEEIEDVNASYKIVRLKK